MFLEITNFKPCLRSVAMSCVAEGQTTTAWQPSNHEFPRRLSTKTENMDPIWLWICLANFVFRFLTLVPLLCIFTLFRISGIVGYLIYLFVIHPWDCLSKASFCDRFKGESFLFATLGASTSKGVLRIFFYDPCDAFLDLFWNLFSLMFLEYFMSSWWMYLDVTIIVLLSKQKL